MKYFFGALCFVIALMFVSCTAPDRSRETLETAGYTEIQIEGYAFFSCSEDDNFKTKFTAKAPSGKRVKGAVCCGVFKGCTIRL